MNEIYHRVRQIAEYYSVAKPSEFAKKTGFSHQVATNYLKEQRNPTAEALTSIKNAFPEVSGDWLLTGIGEMLIPAKSKTEDSFVLSLERELELTRELLVMKDKLIKEIENNRERILTQKMRNTGSN